MTPPLQAETSPALVDLGDDKRFPVELAPHDVATIARWTKVAFSEGDPRPHGVPPAFRHGVLHGFLTALDEAVEGLSESAGDDDPRITKTIEALKVVRDLFPEVQTTTEVQ